MKKYLLLLLFLTVLLSSCIAEAQTDDTYSTDEGDLTVYPVNHGSLVLVFNESTIFIDPFGGAALYSEFGTPDIIFITDIHGDHLNSETLSALNTENTTFIVPQAVMERMEATGKETIVIGNGESREVNGLSVSAIPMYNLPVDDPDTRHPKGRGNGYIIEFAGETVYVSGDTEGIPEMRALEGVDIAFVCMNLPYTMDVSQAADAVIDFQPAVVYPYHHRGQDIQEFKRLVDTAGLDINVKLRDWYPQ